jgi:hypothetical protein
MSWLKVLKDAIGIADAPPDDSAKPRQSAPLFLYVKIPGNIAPLERGRRFEDPLESDSAHLQGRFSCTSTQDGSTSNRSTSREAVQQ